MYTKEALAGRIFELMPQFVSAAQQGHIGGVFVVRQPNHAADAMRGSHFVGNVVLLQPEHAPPSAGEVVHGGAAHTADTDYDGIKLAHLRKPPASGAGQRRAGRGEAQAVYTEVRAVKSIVLKSGPPNAQLAGISGSLMMPRCSPSGAKTDTPPEPVQ